jgi:hypothetical protein
LKTWPKQVLGSLLLAFALLGSPIFNRFFHFYDLRDLTDVPGQGPHRCQVFRRNPRAGGRLLLQGHFEGQGQRVFVELPQRVCFNEITEDALAVFKMRIYRNDRWVLRFFFLSDWLDLMSSLRSNLKKCFNVVPLMCKLDLF